MINYVRFNNFYSFAEETEVSFRVGKQPTMSLYDIQLQTVHGEEVRLNKVITTLGANGSGKTQLLKALPFLAWFVSLSSQSLEKDDEISFSPFKAKENEKSTFEISFFLKKGDQDFDEYRYNRPNDFLSIIRYSDNMRIEGEFIYSANEALNIMYCRKIVLEIFI